MSGSMALALHDLRRRWRDVLATALVIAIGVGAVLVTANIARRTDTAFDRLVTHANAWQVLVNPDQGSESALKPKNIGSLPAVAEWGAVYGIFALRADTDDPAHLFDLPITMVVDPHAMSDLGRPNVLAGRLPSRSAADEVFISRAAAIQERLHVGDPMSIRILSGTEAQQLQSADEEQARQLLAQSTFGQIAHLRVAGIGVATDDFAAGNSNGTPSILLTPAFADKYLNGDALAASGYWGVVARLKPGTTLESFEHDVEQLVPNESVAFQTLESIHAQATRSIRPYSVALAVSGIVLAILVALLGALALSRLAQVDRRDRATWWALGALRSQRFTALVVRAAVAVTVGILGGLLLVGALSWIRAMGPARQADPNHGIYIDGTVVLIGAVAAIVIFGALAVFGAWRASSIRADRHQIRPSALGNRLAAWSFPPAAVVGVRHALEPAQGRDRVPSRAVLVGATAAVIIATAAITFGAGVHQLISSPRLYGWSWDRLITINGDSIDASDGEQVTNWLKNSDDLTGAAMLWLSESTLNGRGVVTAAFDPVASPVEPTIAAGRAPQADDEIALGQLTMRGLGVGIGDTVQATSSDGPMSLRVVGAVVLPTLANYSGADKTALGEGAVVTKATLDKIGPNFQPLGVAITLKPSRSVDAFMATAPSLKGGPVTVQPASRPTDVVDLARVRAAPLVLTILVAVVALVAVGEALFGAARRRRYDLAVLRALGFTSRQSGSCILWQALAIGAVATLIGIPLGAALGRWWWHLLTRYLGGLDTIFLPFAALTATALVTIGATLLLAVVPARSSAHTRAAAVLRAE
jgi:hypothetical protein